MRNTDLTDEPLDDEPLASESESDSEPEPLPPLGNHFSGGTEDDAASNPEVSHAGAGTRRTVTPDETAAYTSAYFANAQRKSAKSSRAASGGSGAARTQSNQTQRAAQAQPVQPSAAAETPRRATGSTRSESGVNPVSYSRSSATRSSSSARSSRSSGGSGGSGHGGGTYHSSYYDDTPHRKHKHRHKRGRRIAGIIAAIVVIVVVVGGVCGFCMVRDYREISAEVPTITEEASSLKDAMMSGDGETVRNTAADIATAVTDIDDRLDSIPWKIASIVPVVGTDVSTVRTMVSQADTLCQYALIPACDSLGDLNLGNLMSDGAINVDLLQSLVSTIQNVAPVVEQSADIIGDLPEPTISRVADIVTQVQDLVASANSAVSSMNEIAPYLPQMLGTEGTRNYLLIAQTNSEVRSTGGLPGSMGVLTVTNGTLSLGEFIPGASLDHYDTPSFGVTDEEVSLFSGVGTAPTSTTLIPDFERAADILCQMWCDQEGGTLDGAIAIDPVMLQDLLALTGGFTTSDGTEVNGDNAAQLLLHDAYQTMDTSTTDSFFSSVADMAFDNVLANLGNIDFGTLISTINDSFENRRIQIYMANDDEENVMVTLGCSGKLNTDETAPAVGVYLNDATWSKISWYLSVDTEVGEGTTNADGTTTYHVTTTLHNNLTSDEAATLVEYITGYNPNKRDTTDMLNIVYIFAPAGGSISNMVYTDDSGSSSEITEETYNGQQFFTNTASTLGGSEVTYSYDVTVSANAEETLGVDTTPTAQTVAGWE